MRKKRWHQHKRVPPWWDHEQGVPWQDGEHPAPPWDNAHWDSWQHGDRRPPWVKEKDWERWRSSGGGLFFRFALAFGLFALLACGALALLGAIAFMFLQTRTFPTPPVPSDLPIPSAPEHPLRWLAFLLGLGFLLVIALRRVGRFAARRITSPLSEIMKAADTLARGDLSARVPVEGDREFRRLARSFNRMAQALETADRQRRELLADVAHELRTPMTIIQGNLEGLRDGVYEPTPEHLDLVLDETHNLGRLVDDLRLLTLAEAGQLPLDFQVLDVAQLLADVRDAFACQADEAGITLALEAGPLLPLAADPQRLGQVLGNLVTNALRHTEPGGKVTLGAQLSPNRDEVRLWVADNGEGIPAEDLPRIFDRFWRGDPARSHEAGAGSGLGLAIAKSLVQAHGGRIWAESQVDQGTTVSCILPLSPAVQAPVQ